MKRLWIRKALDEVGKVAGVQEPGRKRKEKKPEMQAEVQSCGTL